MAYHVIKADKGDDPESRGPGVLFDLMQTESYFFIRLFRPGEARFAGQLTSSSASSAAFRLMASVLAGLHILCNRLVRDANCKSGETGGVSGLSTSIRRVTPGALISSKFLCSKENVLKAVIGRS